MTCQEVRPLLLDRQRGSLAPELEREVEGHLQSCGACTHEEAAEQLLTEALEHRLLQHAAPIALKRRLAIGWLAEPVRRPPSWWSRFGRSFVPALAVASVLLVAIPVYYQRVAGLREAGETGMVAEAVNDHLRILSSQHPLDIEGGGMHQVKPWFEGRLDFAPVVSFLGDQDFPLQGGAVGYFLDRKAAVFVFHRRLHPISLFVFRAEGLPWPARRREPVGNTEAHRTVASGFNVILWQSGELGYALIPTSISTSCWSWRRSSPPGAEPPQRDAALLRSVPIGRRAT
jgi:anti-sigma factor RsiW